MLKEFLEYLSVQAVRAARPVIDEAAPEPDHVYRLNMPDGTSQLVEATPEPRGHRAMSLQPILNFAAKYSEEAAVWYYRHAVVCLTDDETRRDRITLALEQSEPLKKLQAIAGKPIDQREFLLLLRTTFARCLGRAGNLYAVLRAVKFQVNQAGHSNVGPGKASIGKTLEQEITGSADLPETIELDLPIFETGFPMLRGVVECALEADPATQKFSLIPLSGDIEREIAEAEAKIADLLVDGLKLVNAESVPVYYGSP